MQRLEIPLTISALQSSYQQGTLTPLQVTEAIAADLTQRGDDGIWTYTLSEQALIERAKALMTVPMRWLSRSSGPSHLWGIPFSVKDCIDVAGHPTSAACPAFAYNASHTNPAVQKLLDAGAMLIGKTNLDQFATGLVGVRTGYTVPHNAFSADYMAGGSSSGAALSVAHGLVSFAVGTDTGGSGRVPAGCNNIVGLKPTRGLLNTRHTVEACKTLDCLSVFALTAADAEAVLAMAQGDDPENPFSRPAQPPMAHLRGYQPGQPFRFGVPSPEQREFFGNEDVAARYEGTIQTLTELGGTAVEIDYGLFLQANELLFNGPWVAERYASVGKFIEANPAAAFPITRDIILKAKEMSAVNAFEGLYAVAALKRAVEPLWQAIDCLVVPTTGTVYRLDEIEADPLRLNSNLGYYTNFVNLLDLSAIAIPNGFQANGIPTGVTFIAPSFSEAYLTGLGAAFHHAANDRLGATAFKLGRE
ncbi:MAG: allophanate hydrolase [Cyanobacteria bacterium P01_D01_bin.14]